MPSRPVPPAALLALLSILVLPPAAAALPSPELQRLPALPVSPGSVAALVAHVADPAAQARIVDGLRDSRPEVRAAAARVTFVARARLVMPHVLPALGREADDRAAAELVRIVASFDGEASFAQLLAAAASRGPDVQAALAESLARSQPRLLVRLAGQQAGLDPMILTRALVLSSAQHAAEGGTLARAALSSGHPVWPAFLRLMQAEQVSVDPAVLKEGLASSDGTLRTESARYVAVQAGREHGLNRGMIAAAADGAATGDETTWERAYRELARRALQRPPRAVDWAALLESDPVGARASRFTDINASLLGADRARVEAVVGGPLVGAEWYGSKAARDHPESRVQKTRTLSPDVSRLLPDLLEVFGCRARGKSSLAAAEIFYGPDGRPRVVRPGEARLDEACASAAHTAFLVTIAAPLQPVLPRTSDGLFLPFTPEYLACVSQPLEEERPALPGADWVLPRPRERLTPDYPKALKPLKIAGIVRAEVEVTSRGCARAVETVSSLDPLLDVETLRTVLAAPFEPMTIAGRPVASRVIVSVTFKP
jgi:hypothetical protein